MKSCLAIALVLALAAPAARAADAPAPAPAPLPATVEALRASMLASDSILVTRVEMEPAAVSDSAWQSHAPVSRKRVTVNQVKGPWMRRLRPCSAPTPTS